MMIPSCALCILPVENLLHFIPFTLPVSHSMKNSNDLLDQINTLSICIFNSILPLLQWKEKPFPYSKSESGNNHKKSMEQVEDIHQRESALRQ